MQEIELTGKCSIEFICWYAKKMDIHKLTLVQFKNMPLNVQWGVYVDFFDSVGLRISVYHQREYFFFRIDSVIEDGARMNRTEARKAAIEKANEIYNSK